MKQLPCPDCVRVLPKRRQFDVIDKIRRAVEGDSFPPSRFRSNAARGSLTLASGAQRRRADGLALESGDRRRRDLPFLGPLRFSPSAETDSESLLPRPYLMTYKAAWTALDFTIAFCCGSVARLRWPLTGAAGILCNRFSIMEVLLFACCVAVLSCVFGLRPFESVRPVSSELLFIALCVSLAAYGVDGALSSLVTSTSTGTFLEFVMTGIALSLIRTLWRRRWDSNFQRNIAGKNVLIVGANSIGRDIRNHLFSLHYMGIRFKGFVALNEDLEDANENEDGAVVGDIDDVIFLARSMFVDEIIFSRRPATPNVLSGVLAQAQAAGIDVRLIPSFSETLSNRGDLEYLGNLPTIVLHRRKKHVVSTLMKRAIDIVLGSAGIVILSPLFLIIAILIKLQSPGPVLYKSKRVGFKGTTFYCYKFRSMVENADSAQGQLAHLNERRDILFKITKDPRVTSVGAFLRKYSLDEFPQLWNVLKGDMSLVGPRPSIRSEVAQYKTAHLRRLDAIPGMTGLWQVEARQDPSFERYVSLDSKYVRDWSIWLDFKILARTFGAVLKGTGA